MRPSWSAISHESLHSLAERLLSHYMYLVMSNKKLRHTYLCTEHYIPVCTCHYAYIGTSIIIKLLMRIKIDLICKSPFQIHEVLKSWNISTLVTNGLLAAPWCVAKAYLNFTAAFLVLFDLEPSNTIVFLWHIYQQWEKVMIWSLKWLVMTMIRRTDSKSVEHGIKLRHGGYGRPDCHMSI